MAAFGAPGGMEIVIIIVVALLLFVPAIAVFGAGYLFGRRSVEKPRQDEDVSAADRDTMGQLDAPVDEPLPDQDEAPKGEREDG